MMSALPPKKPRLSRTGKPAVKNARKTTLKPRTKAGVVVSAIPPQRMTNYFSGVGRRKTAVARVRLTPSSAPTFTVNGMSLAEYFRPAQLQEIALAPLKATGKSDAFSCSVKVKGGGFHGQAEAVRHGVARSLLAVDAQLRPTLKPHGYLTRDPRMKERKKPGLHRARRAPQWAKR